LGKPVTLKKKLFLYEGEKKSEREGKALYLEDKSRLGKDVLR